MKKAVLILITATILLTFAGCGPEFPVDYRDSLAKMETLSEWPQNEFTADIPEFEVSEGSVIRHNGPDSIYISNVTEEEYLAYIDALKDAGYLFDRNYYDGENFDISYCFERIFIYTVNNIFVKKGQYYSLPMSVLGKGTTQVRISYIEANKQMVSNLGIYISHDVDNMYLIDLSDQSGWPENENTAQIVAPDFASGLPIQAGFGTLNGENVYCIKISELSSEQFEQYISQLEDSGFVESGIVENITLDGSVVISGVMEPTYTKESWCGKKETDNGTIECRLFFGPNVVFVDDTELDMTSFVYIYIMLPTE